MKIIESMNYITIMTFNINLLELNLFSIAVMKSSLLCHLQDRGWRIFLLDPFVDLLNDNRIPFVTRNVLGAGLAAKIGPAAERKRFYVPYANYADAKTLEEAFFSSESIFEE